jgi:hypothetical protein
VKEIGLFFEFITGVALGFEIVEEENYDLFVINLLIVRIILESSKNDNYRY